MVSRSQKRVVVGLAILVVIVLFIVPFINVNRYRLSVARSLSDSLGREVTVQGVSLQTFPQPGLLLSGVVVADDPTISAEPMLRADEVLATLRLSSLWRGRLEIGTLKLKYPSLNIARGADGRWNLASLLERARQIPSAPTAKARPEGRARFPYIESDGGRINLKIGPEKMVFALNEADFALWLAAEDEWRMRLEARPIRTDSNLSDTGTIKMEGTWRRAPQLKQTPLALKVWWERGQMGQLTSLIYGHDRGWRGTVAALAQASGTPEQMRVTADLRVDDFRRYDIATGESVMLQAHCDVDYSFSDKEVRNLLCKAPAGGGQVLAEGSFGLAPQNDLDLKVSAESVPAQFLAVLARRAKKNLPEDLSATGTVSVAFTVHGKENGSRVWAGTAESSAVQINSRVLSKPLVLEPMRSRLVGPGTSGFITQKKTAKRGMSKEEIHAPAALAWRLEPITIGLGGATPATFNAWVSRSDGYYSQLSGEASISRLLEVGRLLGFQVPDADLSGTGKGQLQVAGVWTGFASPTITGNAQLHGVTARLGGVASPLRIANAQFAADKDSVLLSKANANLTGLHSDLEFSARWPRQCVVATQPEDQLRCGMSFEVRADEINVDEINSLLNPRAHKRPWYSALASSVMGSDRRVFPNIYATGRVAAAKMAVNAVTATHVTTAVTITPTGFALRGLSGDALGGSFTCDIDADFREGTPTYTSKGKLQHVAVGTVAALMKDQWASGTLTSSFQGWGSGWNADEIASSASGTAEFRWHDGSLPHIELDRGKPLQFKLFAGTLKLKDGVLTLTESKLQANHGIYEVSGTASLGRQLGLKLARDGGPGYSISGTLERPRVASMKAGETQAALR